MATRASSRGTRGPREFEPLPVDEEFVDLANERIGEIERVAQDVCGELLTELDRMASAGNEDDPSSHRLRAARTELEAQANRLLALTERMRRELLALGEGGADSPPSAGVTLMVNQMAVLGRSESEIAGMLAGFGVAEPRAVVREILTGPHA